MTKSEQRILLMLTSNPNNECFYSSLYDKLLVGIHTYGEVLVNAACRLHDLGFPLSVSREHSRDGWAISPWESRYGYKEVRNQPKANKATQ